MKTQNEFNIKGEVAERLIATLCKDAFFEDFCFRNPHYARGKELCDVLVVLDDIAIIWQIKNIKLKSGQFNTSDIEKAIRQCRGARRRLLKLGTVNFKNVSGKSKVIDTTKIKEVFLIAAIEGGMPDFGRYYDDGNNSGNVHIFFENFTRFAVKHLNTVSDFVEYLRYKEKFLAIHKNIILMAGGEEDLLAIYLQNKRTFGNMGEAENVDMMLMDLEGAADELENKDEDYAEKLEADYWSKGWDELIERKRVGRLILDGTQDNSPDHDKFLQKMMSHNRFERRVLGKQFFDAAAQAAKYPYKESIVYRRLIPQDGHNITYLFLFVGDQNTPREYRQKVLYTTALAAKQIMPQNDMLIAIASELHMIKTPNCSFEWVMLDMTADEFEKGYGDRAREYREKLNIWKNVKMHESHAWEYPSDAREQVKKKTDKNNA